MKTIIISRKNLPPGYINIKDPLRPLSKLSNNSHNDLNFSFLQKEPAQDSLIHNNRNLFKSQIQEITMIKQLSKRTANEDYDVPIVNNCSSNFNNTLFQKQSGVHNMLNNSNTSDFRPTFVSTPKHRYNRTMNSSKRSCFSGRSLRTIKKVNVRNDEYKTNQKPQNKKDNSKMRSLKNRSISSRLFDVINDSCTTLVKTVTNIFKSNRSKMEAKDIAPASNTNAGANESCSYSFTEYMRKRDAGLINDVTKNTSGVSDERNFDNCKTCNDTLQLKRKIISDEYLRETIRKLKLGINIYGCDFKVRWE
ncbi:unnamed protein product [Diatraea saccharalis]|uniref:Uncharacterized protein n=1 Tax=Diatraea saccharalis TaxID=40085 RepID=A0A9N9N2S3_9NEOP|nr:unnamed protein product [Diatraea saccharalis]